MHGEAFLQDLAVVMIVAAVVTVIFHRLRQPVVLGYIVAGVIIGPHTPPFKLINDEHTIQLMAELGIIFLMFSLGLHFSLRKLASVGVTAFIGASLEIVSMTLIGYLIGKAFGWKPMDSLFLGAILSISSTTIIVKALSDLGRTKEKFAELIFGILIVEDVLAIAMIALLSSLGTTGELAIGTVAKTLLRLSVFLTVVLVVGLLTVPMLLRYIARARSNEMLLIAVLGMCFGVALLAVKMQYSVALGAFLIGAIIAEAREAGKVETIIESIRDMFSAVFFVAIGLMINPRMLIDHGWAVVIITIACVVGKVISCSTGTFLAGHDPRTALRVGMGLSQIGEFSFIIAQLGLTLGVTSEFLYPIAVTVSAVTTLLTPYLIQSSDGLVNLIDRRGPRGLVDYLGTYSEWTARTRDQRGANQQIRRLLWKWTFQVALNMALVTGLFIAAVAIAPRAENWIPTTWPRWTGGHRAVVWVAAVIAALPLLVATFRKVRAASMVIAELSVTKAAAGERTAPLRAVVANTILIAVSAAVVLWILLLSSTVLPPWPALLALLVLIAAFVAVAWGSLVRVYARAQIALKETLTTEHPKEAPPPPTLPALLRDAVLETIPLSEKCAGAKKLIRELELRSRSGASIVGIERPSAAPIVNPGPDEELLPGDRVLVLGNAEQLAAARRMLAS